MKLVPPRALLAALAVLISSCALTASAQAFSLDSVDPVASAPSQGSPVPGDPVLRDPTAAAAHPDMAINLTFARDGNDSVAGLRLDLAPGIVSFINHVPVCDSWDATTQTATSCPDSIVGATATRVTLLVEIPLLRIPVGTPLTLRGTIYRIASPDPTRVPAALGIDIDPPISGLQRTKLVSPITVDPATLGLTATLDGLPDEASGFALHIDAITQILYGYTPTQRSFFTNPTSCLPATINVSATSHAGATSASSGTYTPTDCAGVPFGATLTTTADPATPDSTSAISFDVKPTDQDIPRATSHVKGTTVIAPPGVLLNASLAAGLDACTDAGFQQSNTAVAANCPASSEVGSIEFVSPILGAFPGKVYFGTQTPTDRLRLFLDVPLFGAHIKVSATVNPDFTTGQVTTRFSDLPQIAFTDFRLTFNGGPRSALVTPTTCGENVSQAIVGPWSGGADVRPTGSFRTDGNCAPAFTPSMGTTVSNPQGGASTGFSLSFDRPDRTTPVGSVSFDLPPGLIGALALPGLTKCSLVNAAAGNCEASSRIGGVASVVGSGSEPPTLPGSIYLTEPQAAGDPAGLVVVVPARLGPVDAGTVIVKQRLTLTNDGALHVISDAIPALQLGIPLAIRRLTVNVDRDGFMRNPSNCGVKPTGGTFQPLGGGTPATAASSLEFTGCDRLPFTPRIRGVIGGRGLTTVGKQPQFTTTITQRAGEAAMKQAVVTLPRAVATNLPTLRAACDPAAYLARRCATRTIVATAKAVSPLISRPLTGNTYLVRVASGGLPKLMVELRGEVNLDLEGIVTIRKGLVVTTFGTIPDLALSSFELKFRGGPEGVLTTVGDICAGPRLVSTFAGQNGKTAAQSPRLIPEGCTRPRSTASLRFRRGAGTLSIKTTLPSGAKPIATYAVALPRGFTLARAGVSAKAGGKRAGRRALRIRGRNVSVKLPKGGARAVTLKLTKIGASRRVAGRLASRRARVSVRVVTRQTNRAKASQSVRVTLR
ncbi:hypothetical protein [Conexibacter sp. CPCC 206217]|uniref:hypothetical protein n=1 Tax=Conexibacter sp. CPCC 206217 TaxID=3064574 RepID=UPI002716F701|nr:hypothetical protein [Conexibacter sp. CPCC 206217]MDO8210039.1 hypothetical protein [Conexibacter sp. CPCC 206217]